MYRGMGAETYDIISIGLNVCHSLDTLHISVIVKSIRRKNRMTSSHEFLGWVRAVVDVAKNSVVHGVPHRRFVALYKETPGLF